MPIDEIIESGSWIDEGGKSVEFIPFFKTLFVDSVSRKLSLKYDISKCIERAGYLKLGKTQHETFIGKLLGVYSVLRKVVGFEHDDLDAFDHKVNGAYLGTPEGIFREKLILGKKVYFLSEEFLRDKVKVPER